jgi:hypothetical protein
VFLLNVLCNLWCCNIHVDGKTIRPSLLFWENLEKEKLKFEIKGKFGLHINITCKKETHQMLIKLRCIKFILRQIKLIIGFYGPAGRFFFSFFLLKRYCKSGFCYLFQSLLFWENLEKEKLKFEIKGKFGLHINITCKMSDESCIQCINSEYCFFI